MPTQNAVLNEQQASRTEAHVDLLRRLRLWAFYAFLGATAVAVFIPLEPRMPADGLDASWQFALNEAVARGLRFGSDVVFTYGPYAAISTRAYHPATDSRMLWGSLLLGVCYVAALLNLARGRQRMLLMLLLLFLATFNSVEMLLISYAFLIALCAIRKMEDGHERTQPALRGVRMTVGVVAWATLGLLPVVKGSLLLPFAAAVALPVSVLLCRGRVRQAALLTIVPPLATVLLWLGAGQSLADFPSFLRGTLLLTSGYTEAMSTPWVVLPGSVWDLLVLGYFALSGAVFLALRRARHAASLTAWAQGGLCAVFLFVTFKHGFVAVTNVSAVFATLAVYIALLLLSGAGRRLAWPLAIAAVLAAGTSIIHDPVLAEQVHSRFGAGAVWSGSGQQRRDILTFCAKRAAAAYAHSTFESTARSYAAVGSGLISRLSNDDRPFDRFMAARAKIASDHPLPPLDGPADFYEDDVSMLLASGAPWSPRPVLQSYSAYTPELARMDEQHLRQDGAPRSVLFNLESIDRRLPSLDDGLSWPALLDNYSLSQFDSQLVLLSKKTATLRESRYAAFASRRCATGETIELLPTERLLFARIDLKPTLAGRALIALFSPPELRMTLGLSDGTAKTYRVVAEMMQTNFLLSPLVTNNAEFVGMLSAGAEEASPARVRTISVAPVYGGRAYWSASYELSLEEYVGSHTADDK